MVRPNAGLLTALLDMLVDGKFDLKKSPVFRIRIRFKNVSCIGGSDSKRQFEKHG
uniref:Neurobeachin alpha-solenoid region domain-containing protein n=1 Tax=Helianthus annuus TaxID=4232 RepID=A0A251VKH2_HELAN